MSVHFANAVNWLAKLILVRDLSLTDRFVEKLFVAAARYIHRDARLTDYNTSIDT